MSKAVKPVLGAWLRNSDKPDRLKIRSYLHRNVIRQCFVFCPPRSTQHTFADAHSISEDPCCVLGKPKLLNGDGAQLSLNETKTKQRIHYREHNDRKINHTKCARTNLPIYFHLCSFDLSLERKPKKTQNNSFEKKCLKLYYKTIYDVISDLMVSLFLSLFKVFKGLFSFTLN